MAALNASAILRKTQLGDDPGYLAGRGATISDVDGVDLEKIFRGITLAHGSEAAAAFIRTIEDLDTLSGANVINAVGRLERAGWRHQSGAIRSRSVAHDEIGNEAQAQALLIAGITKTGGFSGRDDTQRIRDDFRMVHEAMLEANETLSPDNWFQVNAPRGSHRAR